MTTIKQIKCDICGDVVSDRDKKKTLMGGVQSKNHIIFIFEGFKKEGDLCFSCGVKVDESIKSIKNTIKSTQGVK